MNDAEHKELLFNKYLEVGGWISKILEDGWLEEDYLDMIEAYIAMEMKL